MVVIWVFVLLLLVVFFSLSLHSWADLQLCTMRTYFILQPSIYIYYLLSPNFSLTPPALLFSFSFGSSPVLTSYMFGFPSISSHFHCPIRTRTAVFISCFMKLSIECVCVLLKYKHHIICIRSHCVAGFLFHILSCYTTFALCSPPLSAAHRFPSFSSFSSNLYLFFFNFFFLVPLTHTFYCVEFLLLGSVRFSSVLFHYLEISICS